MEKEAGNYVSMGTRMARTRDLRRQVEEAVAPLTYSVDGETFLYVAPLSGPKLPLGGFVTLRVDDGTTHFGQIVTRDVVSVQGPEMAAQFSAQELGQTGPGAASIGLSTRLEIRQLEGVGAILGTFTGGAFKVHTEVAPFQDARLAVADGEQIAGYLAAARRRTTPLQIGNALHVETAMPVTIDARGFTRHTFLCGQSGSGKTFSLGVVVEQLLLNTDLRMIVIDPNSDFVNLTEMLVLDDLNRSRPVPIDEDGYRELARRFGETMAGVRVYRPASQGSARPLRLRFSDFTRRAQAALLQLDPLADREEAGLAIDIIDAMPERYSMTEFADAFGSRDDAQARNLALRIKSLGLDTWDLWSRPGEDSLLDALDDDWRCLVVDIGTVERPLEKSAVALALLGRLWQDRHQREPVLVVIDEAHNVVPQDPDDAVTRLCTDLGIVIAGEGRKFGLYLLLASQRPSKIHANVLSQCENLMLMRMNSQADLAHLTTIFSHVPASLMAESSHFSLGESLIAGRIADPASFLRFGGRLSREGGGDVPATWADGTSKPAAS